tara:strand:- start:89 stop:700 length:612 start_codon:yes stop_codon:yes gene_type:complete
MKYFLILLLFSIASPFAHSNDYFKALEMFNLRKIEQSLTYFKKVANDEKNEKRSDAMFNLAVIYDNGFGIAADKTRALHYYKAASDLSNIYAQYNLGWKYFNGESVYKDVGKAFSLYESASRYGHPQATFNLANMHYLGVGTVKNIKKAYKLFLLAKINGIKESEYFLDLIQKQISPEELMALNSEYSSLIEEKIIIPKEVTE